MKKDRFSELLTDLYQAYNPDYLQYVPQLVEKYSGMEFSAVEMVLIKYNRRTASYFDPLKETDEYKHSLIKEYSSGNRTLKDFKVQNEVNLRKDEAENKFAEERKKFQENVNQTIDNLKSEFSGKEKELIDAYKNKIIELNELIKSAQPVKTSVFEDIDIKITSNYTEHPLKLPNKEAMMGIGVGARIITSTLDGSKIIGLKVVDIVYDNVSSIDNKPMIEIILDRE